MKFVIHAGRHKTGTTSLQSFFRDNADALLDGPGILYPATGREKKRNHHRFFDEVFYEGGKRSSLIDQLCREIEEFQPRIVLMSSEVLSRDSVTERRLRKLKRDIPYETTLAFYLRRQDEFLLSMYAERVKAGLLAHPRSIWDFDGELDYEAFLERYAAVFGADQLAVRSYDDAKARGIVKDFGELLGAPEINSFRKPKPRNLRYSWSHIALLRLANRQATARALIRRRPIGQALRTAATIIPAIFDQPKPLTEIQRAGLRAQFAESNRRLARKYLGRDALFAED